MQRSNLKRDHRIIAVPFEPPSQSPAAVSTSISVTRLVDSACVEVEPGRMKATFEISRGVSSSLEVSNVAAPVCTFITLITCSTMQPLHFSQFKNERIARLKFETFEFYDDACATLRCYQRERRLWYKASSVFTLPRCQNGSSKNIRHST
jgi:hypothetical protein